MPADHDRLREAIKAVWELPQSYIDTRCGPFRTILAAAESTLPRTKMVEVWRVESAQGSVGNTGRWTPLVSTYQSEAEARSSAAAHQESYMWACVRVTGPHQQEVPDNGAEPATRTDRDSK